MLDRLRFQEIEKAIFKVRESGTYGNRYLCSNEPFLIIDNASISNFSVGERDKNAVGRSTEASTATIKNVQFNLSNGQIMLNLFNTIFGDTKNSQPTTYTVNDVIEFYKNLFRFCPSAFLPKLAFSAAVPCRCHCFARYKMPQTRTYYHCKGGESDHEQKFSEQQPEQ